MFLEQQLSLVFTTIGEPVSLQLIERRGRARGQGRSNTVEMRVTHRFSVALRRTVPLGIDINPSEQRAASSMSHLF